MHDILYFLLLADYIDDIYNTFLDAKKCNTLRAAKEDLEAMTPAPINTMIEKQPRDEAIELWKKRKSMVVQDIPSTVAGIPYLLFLGHTFEQYINVCSKEWIHVLFHFIH